MSRCKGKLAEDTGFVVSVINRPRLAPRDTRRDPEPSPVFLPDASPHLICGKFGIMCGLSADCDGAH